MKTLIRQLFIGFIIIAFMLSGIYFLYTPEAVHSRKMKSDILTIDKEVLNSYKSFTYEEASRLFHTDQSLLLVNNEHQIDSDYPSALSEYKDTGVLMNTCAISSYSSLSSDIMTKFNDKLYVSSTYRSYEDQQRVYEEEGPEIAALPGASEHQTGLAFDVYVMYYAGAGFIDSEVGRFVNNNCYDYGFIIRYPLGMEDITGFAYEPWHIRYVGLPHSKIIRDTSCLLDEYYSLYDVGKYYNYDNYLIGRMPLDDIRIPDEYLSNSSASNQISLSLDGTGYVFVTIKTEGI